MASSTTALRLRATDGGSLALLGGIGVAWSVIILAETTGAAPALHHHALIDNGPPLPIAVALFLASWLVMVVAMMVPASFGVIRGMADAGTMLDRPRQVPAGFLAGFLLVWSGFGIVAFTGDMGLHRVVDATPWLGARPWLIEAAVLALAGACQFAPLTRHCLEDCRRSGADAAGPPAPGRERAPARVRPRACVSRRDLGAHAPHVRGGVRQPLVDGRPHRVDGLAVDDHATVAGRRRCPGSSFCWRP